MIQTKVYNYRISETGKRCFNPDFNNNIKKRKINDDDSDNSNENEQQEQKKGNNKTKRENSYTQINTKDIKNKKYKKDDNHSRSKCASKLKFNMIVSYNFNLDAFLTDDYHKRHEISRTDIKKILKYSDHDQLRMCAMINGIDVKILTRTNGNSIDESKNKINIKEDNTIDIIEYDSENENEDDELQTKNKNLNPNNIKIPYHHEQNLDPDSNNNHIHQSQQQITNVKKLLEDFFMKSLQIFSFADHLILKNDEHRPPLPIHFVTLDLLLMCYNNRNKKSITNLSDEDYETTNKSKKNTNKNKSNEYDHNKLQKLDYTFQHQLIRWKDIDILPFDIYKGYLKMVRVIPRSQYEKLYGSIKNDISRPFEYLINGIVYCGLNKEFMLLQTKTGHQYLSELSSVNKKKFDNILYI